MVASSSFSTPCLLSSAARPINRERRAAATASAQPKRTCVVPVPPRTQRCATAGAAAAMSMTRKWFSVTMPLLRNNNHNNDNYGGAVSNAIGSIGGKAGLSVPLDSTSSRMMMAEQPGTATRRGRWTSVGRVREEDHEEENNDRDLRLISHAVAVGPRGDDSRHARLLLEERERHRLAADRLHQKAQRIEMKLERERAAHAETARLLLREKMETCILQEACARYAIAAAEAKDRIDFMQCSKCMTWEGKKEETATIPAGMSARPSTYHSMPAILYAYDSDLLRALQRSEAHIAYLEGSSDHNRNHHYHRAFSRSSIPSSHSVRDNAHSKTREEPAVADTALNTAVPSYVPLSPSIRIIV